VRRSAGGAAPSIAASAVLSVAGGPPSNATAASTIGSGDGRVVCASNAIIASTIPCDCVLEAAE